MNPAQPPLPPPENLASQANAWVVRLTSGQATVEDARALREWCATSAAHAEAYRQAAQLWKQTGEVAALAKPLAPPRRRHIALASAVAACIALVVVGWTQLGGLADARAVLADHHTAPGDQQRIELEDGSIIEMDARSRLNVEFSATQRHISLGGGAAVFHVQHDAKRPFVVSAAGGTVTAIGTVFEVREQGAGIKVTCSEGVVAVNQSGARQLLSAGEQLRYGEQGISAQAKVDAEQELAWRQGLLVFKNRPLQELVDELNRYHRGRIVLTSARIAALPVSGVFHLQRPDEALRHIEQTLQLSATELPAGLVLLR
ncbi:MAG: FecR family protein [Pseudomonas sp.]|uniref:FecR family protein n=1 Tax=Pseudomonas sp. TaxID=306 RepID=UPI0030F30AAC